jgi:hypothetical protein
MVKPECITVISYGKTSVLYRRVKVNGGQCVMYNDIRVKSERSAVDWWWTADCVLCVVCLGAEAMVYMIVSVITIYYYTVLDQ